MQKTSALDCMQIQSTPDNSNLQGKEKIVRVTESLSYQGQNYVESDLKGTVDWFELVRGLSYRNSTVFSPVSFV